MSKNKYITKENINVVEALSKIDEGAKGILYVVNENDQLIGSVTDGDIRRWIIKSNDLTASISLFMNRSPKYIYKSDKGDINALFEKWSIKSLPVLNEHRQIVDICFSSNNNSVYTYEKNNALKDVPVVIMAGGKGTRLYPYTKILPKPLIPIGEIPIVERIINLFVNYGIDKLYMSVNYKSGMIESFFSDLDPDYELIYVKEDKPLGTGGSLKLIDEKFDRPLFVTNCDALIFADYKDLYNYHIKSNNAITIVAALKNVTIPYGVLNIKEDGELLSMEEKPQFSYLINTGMYIINPETIESIPDDTFFHMTHLIDAVRENGGKVGVYPVSEDSFLDMGEFSEMQRMEKKLNIGVD